MDFLRPFPHQINFFFILIIIKCQHKLLIYWVLKWKKLERADTCSLCVLMSALLWGNEQCTWTLLQMNAYYRLGLIHSRSYPSTHRARAIDFSLGGKGGPLVTQDNPYYSSGMAVDLTTAVSIVSKTFQGCKSILTVTVSCCLTSLSLTVPSARWEQYFPWRLPKNGRFQLTCL